MTENEIAIKWLDLEILVTKSIEDCTNSFIKEKMLEQLDFNRSSITKILGYLEFDKINKTGRYD